MVGGSAAGSALRPLGLRHLLPMVIGVLAGAAAGPPATAQTPAASEYQLKAVFLYNFAQFVTWPDSAFPSADAPLVIGVLGEDPFGPYLDQTVKGEMVNSHPLVVQRFHEVDEIKTCHILFVSQQEKDHFPRILAALKGRGILTVGDVEGFASKGGMIRFVTERNRIRLRINLEVARADDLTISSKLLRPAQIVTTGGD